MPKLSFKEVKDMFEQLDYKDIKEVENRIYSVVNPFGEPREFITIEEDNDIRLLSRRNLLEVMENKKDFQTFEAEFISDDESFKIIISDFTIGNNIQKHIKSDNYEVIDLEYNVEN